MKDSIRIPGTHVKVKSTSHLHEGVEGIVDRDYGYTIQIRLDKEYESHKHAYRSRIGFLEVKPGQKPTDFREGLFIMVRAESVREIPKKEET